ncbi:D-amino-acid transaminase [Bacteroidota bacterium]
MSKQLIVYFNGKFLPQNEVHISPNDRGFVFGDGTYEVFRAYNSRLFYAEEHLRRLEYSLYELKINKPDLEVIIPVVRELIVQNKLEDRDATIYLQITRGVFSRMHAFPNEKVEPTIFIRAREFKPYSPLFFQKGVKAITMNDFRWLRCDIKSTALLSNILAAQQAAECDAFESIFVRNSLVTEGSHTNVFVVKDNIVYTHPKSNFILSGISREIVIELCQQHGLNIKLSPFTEQFMSEADEVFLVGTSTEVMPVVSLNKTKVGHGKVGPVTDKIQQFYSDFIREYLEAQ